MMRASALFTALLLAPTLAAAQLRPGAVNTGVQFQGYDFDDGLGVEAANLLLVPLSWQVAVGDRLSFDAYGAWARGTALIAGTQYELNGLVDTRVRANYAVTPWAMVTLGLNLPTGQTEHTEDEARVAAVLASDLLGFREANFGLGFGATTGLATAYRVGETGLGVGLSYRFASDFQPSADTTLEYTPGNEIRVRVGADRNIGSSKLTAGITYQNFARDELDGRDLFQAGNRLRGDVTFSFRSGPGATWTAYVTDVWRDRGDVRLEVLNPQGGPASQTLVTGRQNLLIAGVTGAWRARPTLVVQPLAEVRLLSREDDGGEGWLAGAGATVPLRLGRFSVVPGARLNYGSVQAETDTGYRALGGEINVSVTFGGR